MHIIPKLTFALLGSTLLATSASAAVEIIVVNLNDPGEGFNDPAPYTQGGGNPATTLGQARLLALQFAAQQIGSCLESDVPITIEAQFKSMFCDGTSAVLGAAGPTTLERDFTGAPLTGTWYVQALANALLGADTAPAFADIGADFNWLIDQGCLSGTGFYYGFDGKGPANDIDFVSICMHELSHGLGFLSLVNSDGSLTGGFDDAFSVLLEHHGASPPDFPSMTDTQRKNALTATNNLHWTGTKTNAKGTSILDNGMSGGHVKMYAPGTLQPGSSGSHFSPSLMPNELMEPSYVGVNHALSLALDVFCDIGWELADKNGVDIVFLFDVSGSTGALVSEWVAQIPAIAQAWKDYDPNARFALTSHVDFPFEPYGVAGEWAYRVESTFDPSIANLQDALELLTQKFGNDTPESQYEAVYQILTGKGRDLSGPVNYSGPGEIFPVPLGQKYPMAIYHFTWPASLPAHYHDADIEPDYPFVGSKPVAGKADVITQMAIKSGQNMFFGLTLVSLDLPDGMHGPRRNPQLAPVASYAGGSPLQELADLTGGEVYELDGALLNLQDAIDASILVWDGSPQGSGDADGDGILPPMDNCPYSFNPMQDDADGDGVGDSCDNCPDTFNPEQADGNFDGVGDVCSSTAWIDLGNAKPGTNGLPLLDGVGSLAGGSLGSLELSNTLAFTAATLVLGLGQINAPFKGGVLVPTPDVLATLPTDATGSLSLPFVWPVGLPSGVSLYYQYWISDPGALLGFAASNGLESVTP